jgi:catechol 2,3-dioxygenase-like lactoylglutathione lyase family enzyme
LCADPQGPSGEVPRAGLRGRRAVDLLRLADATGTTVRALPESLGGVTVDLVDPSGLPVRVVSGTHQLEALPTAQTPHVFNFGHEKVRTNATQRPPRVPTNVQRLGHIVVQTPKYIEALNWYLDTFGMIVSDFSYYPGQRERGPILSFIRCDRGSVPADHHTLAMALGPVKRYMHSAYEVADLDALAAGGEYLREQGYFRSWGIGRHIEGSQIFDYWRDPDGFLVEHYADGDMFDNTLEPGWAEMRASGLYQWGTSAEQGLPGCRIASGNRERARLDARCASSRQRIRPVRAARPLQRRQFLTQYPTERKKNAL